MPPPVPGRTTDRACNQSSLYIPMLPTRPGYTPHTPRNPGRAHPPAAHPNPLPALPTMRTISPSGVTHPSARRLRALWPVLALAMPPPPTRGGRGKRRMVGPAPTTWQVNAFFIASAISCPRSHERGNYGDQCCAHRSRDLIHPPEVDGYSIVLRYVVEGRPANTMSPMPQPVFVAGLDYRCHFLGGTWQDHRKRKNRRNLLFLRIGPGTGVPGITDDDSRVPGYIFPPDDRFERRVRLARYCHVPTAFNRRIHDEFNEAFDLDIQGDSAPRLSCVVHNPRTQSQMVAPVEEARRACPSPPLANSVDLFLRHQPAAYENSALFHLTNRTPRPWQQIAGAS